MPSMIDSDAAYIPAINFTDAPAKPAAPMSGHHKIYFRDGSFRILDSSGYEDTNAAIVSLTTDRLAVGGSLNALTALTPGVTGAVPTRQADGTIAEVVPGGGGGGALALIASYTVPSGGVQSHTFSAIPGTATHLHLVGMGRVSGSTSYGERVELTFNGDGASHYMAGIIAAASNYAADDPPASASRSSIAVGTFPNAQATAGNCGSFTLDVFYYALTVFRKMIRSNWGAFITTDATSQQTGQVSGAWNATAAITSLTVAVASLMLEGSRLDLYGLT